MNLIEWDESLSVNDPEMDEQHRRLVAIINDLYAGMEGGGSAVIAVSALAAMREYVRKHFSAEECYLRQIGFPGAIAHIKAHNEFCELIELHCATAMLGETVPVGELLHALSAWLVEHLLTEDKKYSDYAAGKR
jgi:hemerythrin-like metal-binding protein